VGGSLVDDCQASRFPSRIVRRVKPVDGAAEVKDAHNEEDEYRNDQCELNQSLPDL
jgi:hypothetical protein